ncbi:uncharacterized protein LOC109400772 [Aedes albopictus]|uniref:Uncharacterized protein n=1 Tax=Aedes albopictus TaxID=7160 RepID=A0ABM1Y7B5_AEDAL
MIEMNLCCLWTDNYGNAKIVMRYSSFSGITIKPSAAEVPLQSLVDHTNKRLIESHRSILAGSACNTFEINYKWGCDGSSNHSRYKQNFVETDEDGELREYNDSHIFSMALVPLQLIGRISEHERDIFWKNDLPSSVSLCRPIKLIFLKESAQLTRNEVEKVRDQIKNLRPTEILQDGRTITVYSSLILSMMDTKVVNDLTETNSQSCSFCGKSGKNLNDATNDLNETNAEKFSRGFSPLHCYIRTMELFLKVAYRLKMEKPTWPVAKSNEAVRQREATIRAEIKRRLGLRISEPLPSGGNSNDGNTSRTFFKEWRSTGENVHHSSYYQL